MQRITIDSRSSSDSSQTDAISFKYGRSNILAVTGSYDPWIVAGKDPEGGVSMPARRLVKTMVSGHLDQRFLIDPQLFELRHDITKQLIIFNDPLRVICGILACQMAPHIWIPE